MYRQILVPIDDSELSTYTSSKAVELAKAIGARVVFFHARSDFGATDGGALVRVISPTGFAESSAGSARAFLAKAEVAAQFAGVPYESIARTSDRPYEAILDIAEEKGCDLIFMSSHGRRGLKGLLIGSQTQKVLAHTTIPVLVTTVESNTLTPEMNSALSVIKGEHRSLAAVMHGLKELMSQARESNGTVDVRLVRAIILYLRRFPQELHHPKEEQYLFGRLLGYVPSADKTISLLEQQHKEEPALIDAIETAVAAYELSPDASHVAALGEATDRFAERLWEHMSLEENDILPNCRKHFSTSDWKQIAEAFEQNGDPRFDKDKESGYEDFFSRIMNLAETLEKK